MIKQLIRVLPILLLLALCQLSSRAQTTFTLPNANFVFEGYWGATANAGGHQARQCLGTNSQADFQFTGTGCTITAFGSTGTLTLLLDGASSTPTWTTGGTWQVITIATGLTDTTHTVTLIGGGMYIDMNYGISVTGSSPALVAPSTLPMWQSSTYIANCPNGFQLSTNDTTYLANSNYEGGFITTSIGSYQSYKHCDWVLGAISFHAKTSYLWGWAYCNGQNYHVYIDGVDHGLFTVPAPAGGRWGWVQYATGLDAANDHEYQVVAANTSSFCMTPVWWMLSSSSSLQTHAYTARQTIVGYGDSIMFGAFVSPFDSTISLCWLISRGTLGLAAANKGISGTLVKAGTNSGSTRTADITGMSPAPTAVLINYGTNDMAQVGGAETIAQYQAAYLTMLNAIIAGLPANTPIYCVSIYPRSSYTPATIDSWNAGIINAIALSNNPSQCHYINVTDTNVILQNNGTNSNFTDPNSDTADGLHLAAQGYTKMYNYLKQYIVVNVAGKYKRRPSFRFGTRASTF